VLTDCHTGPAADARKVANGSLNVATAVLADVLLYASRIAAAADGFQRRWVRLVAVGSSAMVAPAVMRDPYFTAASRHAGGTATTTCAATAKSATMAWVFANMMFGVL